MAPTTLQHRRTHNLLLISKLLSQRENVSPFTLIVDNLEQSGKPVLREYIRRATVAKTEVIFVSFETLKKPKDVGVFVKAWESGVQQAQKEVGALIAKATQAQQRKLLIIDNLNTLASDPATAANLPALLSSFLSPTVSLVAVYHAYIPIPPSISSAAPYTPQPLTVLKYLATTILTTHALNHVLAAKAARERSVAEPVFGLAEETEGVLLGLGGNSTSGLVLEMEYRRKSGRGVREWYFLPHPALQKQETVGVKNRFSETVMLLEDHVLYRRPVEEKEQAGDDMDVTFELGLTDRQRQAREGVVLPYFDAQKGGGEGGRILYDMGEEDDFDEEEDEI
ncbi:hypothetical protein KCU67_g4997, partial [Aureobasidium melanogenum]